jgi:hypothetical protein
MNSPTYPSKTFYNEKDGHTYWIRPAAETVGKRADELWACPTLADGTPEFASALLVEHFDDPLTSEERQRIVGVLTEVREIVWKDEGRDDEGQSIGPAYAEDATGNVIVNFDWVTWKKAHDISSRLQVELNEV